MKKKYVQPASYAVEMEGDFCVDPGSKNGDLNGGVGLGKPGSGGIGGFVEDNAATSSSVWDDSSND